MAKTSYFGGPTAPNLGSKPPIHKQPIPGYDQKNYKLVMSEEEKEEDHFYSMKTLVYNYERIGRQQLQMIRREIIKKFNLAYGVIDQSDYIKESSEYDAEITMLANEDLQFDLKFFPIIPNIVNTLANYLTKIKVEYSALAVNPEAQNEILEQKNEQIKNLLISKAKELFDFNMEQQGVTPQTQPDVYQQQLDVFMALPKIQQYFSVDYRLDIETWAAHRIEIDNQKHNMRDLEKDLMFNKITCDRPFIHTNLLDEDYRPEVLRPENCFYLRSPYAKDVSEGVMFGWFEYDSSVNLINKHGNKLKEEDIQKLQQFYLSTRFTQNTRETRNVDVPDDIAMAQNYIGFKTEFRDRSDHNFRGDEWKEQLVETMHMYLQVPRKLQKLIMVGTDGTKVSTIVDENYKVTIKPIYSGKTKNENTLVFGEHIEPFYINELWRCIKINLTRNPNPDLGNDIWVVLEKYPVQISNPKISKYGSLIPVNGGPQTNEYSPSVSIVDKCKPWQVFYNYLWNRNNQILETELGVFMMFNQNMIPQESLGEEWGKNNLIKFLLTARDTGLAPLDVNLNQMGQQTPGLTGGFGQKMDLTRTDEVLSKARLAEICKEECLQIVGISPQLLGDISPNETATGVTQGIQRSITQLKHLYDEHFLMMEKARQTMLEIAQYIAIKKGSIEESYMTSDKQRVIFQTTTENFPLYQIGIYVTSDFNDMLLMEEMKINILRDNTLGADVIDKLSIVDSNSIGQMYDKLKDLQQSKEKQVQERQRQEMAMQQQLIQAESDRLEKRMEFDRGQLLLELESRENQAELRALGSTGFAQGNGVEEITKLKTQQLKEDTFYQSILQTAQANQLKRQQLATQSTDNGLALQQEDTLERERLKVEREKILAKLKVSQNELEVAKVNK